MAHLALAAGVYATVLLTAEDGATVAPWVSSTLDMVHLRQAATVVDTPPPAA